MGCKRKSTKSRCKHGKGLNIRGSEQKSEECIPDNPRYKYIGREQFFWHYPKSKLPIRDITEKTEPHIEIGAENYLRTCIQRNIRSFCHNPEKYLFLCTTCKNREVGGGEFSGKRFVVGYIEKKKRNGCRNIDNRLAVIGKTCIIVPFDKKLEYGKLRFKRSRAMRRFNKKDGEKLLKIIKTHKNIRRKCVNEMRKKEREYYKKYNKKLPIDKKYGGCLQNGCEFKHKCFRRKKK